MTIDDVIVKYKEITNTDTNCPAHCNISCDKCVQESKQLVEWLEELKAIKSDGFTDDFANIAFTKAIDKCLKILYFHENEYDGIEWAIREIEELNKMDID